MVDYLSWIIPTHGEIELRALDADAVAELADEGFQPYTIRSSRGSLLVVYAQQAQVVRQIQRLLERDRLRPSAGRRLNAG